MGLDMYLERKIYIGGKWEHNQISGDFNIYKRGLKLPLELKDVQYVVQEVCYWRKANAIHNWFVNNVQNEDDDCGQYYVSEEKLTELLNLCKEVKEKAILKDGDVVNGQTFDGKGNWVDIIEKGQVIENAEEISKILPTQSGFFFGSTDYNQWYYEDIINTIDMLEKVLKEDKEFNDKGFYTSYEYTSSW